MWWSLLIKHWRLCLIAALSCVVVGLTYYADSEHNSIIKERAAHQVDVDNFKQAQKTANAKAKAEKEQLQKEAKANADKADAQSATLLAQYRASLVRYQASQSGGKQSDHSELSSAQGGDGSSTGSGVFEEVTISVEDAQICAANTARLQAVHDWALNPPKDGN